MSGGSQPPVTHGTHTYMKTFTRKIKTTRVAVIKYERKEFRHRNKNNKYIYF